MSLSVTDTYFCGNQIKAVAALANLELSGPASYEHFKDNKEPAFLAKFPHGKIPSFESAEGFKLFEGYAIARYGECLLSVI